MKYCKILFLALSFALLLPSCQPKGNDDLPADLSGNWVFSASNSGNGWQDMNIDKVYTFDGSGHYSVKTSRSNSAKITFYNGKVYAEESDFVLSGGPYDVVVRNGKSYVFGSLEGEYGIVSQAADLLTLSKSGVSLRLSKVSTFSASVNPVNPDPDPGKEDPTGPSINGTSLVSGNDLVGLISDSSTGKGIPDVVVSDGYDCVRTDANGVYQFKSNKLTRIIYYSTPSEYRIAYGSYPSIPVFYKEIKPDGSVLRTDFRLDPLPGGSEKNWTFIGIGDPQCATASNANRYSTETIPDIKATMAGRSNVYAMTLGDIVFDSTNMWPSMRTSMSSVSTGAWFIPFFQTIGNHDHDSLKSDTSDDLMDDYNATSTFVSFYGPTDYSFNRGDVHIVSMDDIPVTAKKTSSKSNGYTWSYGKGFTDSQLSWLKKDLELVQDKGNKMIFICCHIPFRNVANTKFSYCQEVTNLMLQFKEAHLMIGHTHYTQNFVYAKKAKGGLPLYEHIHGSACGAWWTSNCSSTVTGEPSGYTIYDVEGAHIKDWHFKGTRKDADEQFRVFDGNEIYYQTASYPLNWYTATQKAGSGSYTVKGNASLKGCFVAQVFNDDDTYWKVELLRKSTRAKIGDFKRLANGTATNVAMSAHYFNKKNKNSDSYASTTASHYWYYKPTSAAPASETDWVVVVTQTLPDGKTTHTWEVSALTRESDLEKAFHF